ncbi:hypothetical protein JMM81_04775 [Bacillus sp. V3B]|uniref:CotO family spore coat protein n=1 Tax=Bacillus sp. V3B TaxID=2804915 RepID=UPI00210A7445|nr:CotO family spore coat protein [Bacillus sp. V3B]MCQ6274290.1 hypothetical protein [Bacillus sp. V3B]
MSNNKSRDPLLYIQQPNFTFPKANMQQTYLVKKEEETKKSTPTPLSDVENKTQIRSESERSHKSSSRGQEAKVKKGEGNKIAELNPEREERADSQADESKQELNSTVVQEVIDQYHEKEQKEDKASANKQKQHSYSFKRVKSFKEMSTTEKLNYLVHFPKLLPPVPCIFITGNSSVRGFLMNRTEESVEIKQFNETIMHIPIENLTDVKMIGLQ